VSWQHRPPLKVANFAKGQLQREIPEEKKPRAIRSQPETSPRTITQQ
jgi:hypothetical protein